MEGAVIEGVSNQVALGILVLVLVVLIAIPSLRRRRRRATPPRQERTPPPLRAKREETDAALLASRIEGRLAALEARFAGQGASTSGEIEARLAAARRALDTVTAEREAQMLEIVAHETELANLRDAITASARQAYGGAAGQLAELRANLASETLRREAAVAEAEANKEALRQARDMIERQRIERSSLDHSSPRGSLPALPPPDNEKAAMLARIAALEEENRLLKSGSMPTTPAVTSDEVLRAEVRAISAAVAEFSSLRLSDEDGIGAPAGLPGLAARIRARKPLSKD